MIHEYGQLHFELLNKLHNIKNTHANVVLLYWHKPKIIKPNTIINFNSFRI